MFAANIMNHGSLCNYFFIFSTNGFSKMGKDFLQKSTIMFMCRMEFTLASIRLILRFTPVGDCF